MINFPKGGGGTVIRSPPPPYSLLEFWFRSPEINICLIVLLREGCINHKERFPNWSARGSKCVPTWYRSSTVWFQLGWLRLAIWGLCWWVLWGISSFYSWYHFEDIWREQKERAATSASSACSMGAHEVFQPVAACAMGSWPCRERIDAYPKAI